MLHDCCVNKWGDSKSRPSCPCLYGSLLAVTDIRCTDQIALRYSAGDFARSSGASDRVFGLLTRLCPAGSGRGGTRLARVRGELELRHVWFRYQTASQTQWALQNVTLRMEPGSVVALVRRRELDGLNLDTVWAAGGRNLSRLYV